MYTFSNNYGTKDNLTKLVKDSGTWKKRKGSFIIMMCYTLLFRCDYLLAGECKKLLHMGLIQKSHFCDRWNFTNIFNSTYFPDMKWNTIVNK